MPVETIPWKRSLAFGSILLALASILILVPGRGALAAHDDCELTVRGPFFYAGLVFPVAEIQCQTQKQSIHLEATLEMDGSEVATASRTCRKTAECTLGLASDGVFAHDVPGDQVWCGSAMGSINNRGPRHFLGQVTSCEAESF